ncbi:MAG: hypothetical protein LBN08_05580 [Lactobacillales bacterium]|jgi:hypothetical protein|nr:hypothetical protein [Lactobacillales bacterium]
MYEDLTAINIIYDIAARARKPYIYTGVSACALLKLPIFDRFNYRKPRVIGGSRGKNANVKCFSPTLFNKNEQLNAKLNYTCANYLKIILDAGKEFSAVGLIILISHCLFKCHVSHEELKRFIENNKSVRGMSNLRKVLPFVSDGDESPYETLVRLAIYLLGYEDPIQQLPFYENGRYVGRIDFFWQTRKGRMAFETDGADKGKDPDYYERERLRQATLEKQGYKVYRMMYKQLTRNELPELLEAMGVRKARKPPRKLPIINGLKNTNRF